MKPAVLKTVLSEFSNCLIGRQKTLQRLLGQPVAELLGDDSCCTKIGANVSGVPTKPPTVNRAVVSATSGFLKVRPLKARARQKPRMRLAIAVHPHARGDNCSPRAPVVANCGSPPRAWGQRGGANLSMGSIRFTPTRVGTTGTNGPYHLGWTVHPHARGDNSGENRFDVTTNGSPPRAWGQQH